MARFSDNPLKNTPAGNEFIPATDPSTGSDVSFTPLIITQFVATSMGVAAGSTNGLIDAASYAKLLALDTQAQTDTRVSQLAEVPIPVFVGTPVDGSFRIYQHVCDVAFALDFVYQYCSAGSTNVTWTKNGVAIPGFTTNPASGTSQMFTVSGGSTGYTLNAGDVLGMTFTGTTGNCVNFYGSIRANAGISS